MGRAPVRQIMVIGSWPFGDFAYSLNVEVIESAGYVVHQECRILSQPLLVVRARLAAIGHLHLPTIQLKVRQTLTQ